MYCVYPYRLSSSIDLFSVFQTCPHRYSRQEPCSVISVDVKNHSNLQDSLAEYTKVPYAAVLRIWNVYPESRIQIFPSLIQGQKDFSGSVSALKNSSILTQQIVSKLSEIFSGMFIPDPDLDFLPISDPESRGQKVPSKAHNKQKKFVVLLKDNDENCRIRIRIH